MTSLPIFQFGVEIELLIGSRTKTHKTWKGLATELSTKLAKAGIENHVNDGPDKSVDNYQEWSIIQEVTIPSQGSKNLWGLELVSPVFYTTDPWNAHLSAVFKVLKAGFTVSTSSNTSTHIHLSTSPPIAAHTLVSIAKSILYFEPALDTLLPASRANTYWCQSNRTNPLLKPLSLPQCFDYLDYYGTDVESVVKTMCLYPASSPYGRAHGYTEDFVHGVYKWDFSGLLPGGIGTIEFRQAPGSRSADEVKTWIELAVSFVAGAADGGAALLDPSKSVTMEELWWMLSSGAQTAGLPDMRNIEKLWVESGKGSKSKSSRK